MYKVILLQPIEQTFENIAAKYMPWLIGALIAEYGEALELRIAAAGLPVADQPQPSDHPDTFDQAAARCARTLAGIDTPQARRMLAVLQQYDAPDTTAAN